MNLKFLLATTLLLFSCYTQSTCSDVNYGENITVNSALLGSVCNQQTQIDFTFPQKYSGNTMINPNLGIYTLPTSDPTLQFLNQIGQNLSYTLIDFRLSTYTDGRIQYNGADSKAQLYFKPDFELSLRYYNSQNAADTVVVIHLLNYNSTLNYRNIINTATNPNIGAFTTFISGINNSNNNFTQLSSLSFLNTMDLGHFYAIPSTPSGSSNCNRINYLVNSWIYMLPSTITLTVPTTSSIGTYMNDQATKFDKLCYGSLTNSGIFQTHMRESYPLWVAWFGVLFFWFSILLSEPTNVNVFDKNFKDNKWTNWRLYSLYHLAHEEFFTKMSRTVPIYINLTWQCTVLACLYSQLGTTYTTAVTIIWFGVIAWAASFPIQFLYGAFLQQIYENTLKKFQIKKKIKGLFDKEGSEAQDYERQIDEKEDIIYSCYYWMYVLSFFFLVTFYTLSVNRMQQLPRQYYYEMNYWLAALGVAIALDHFIIDPLLTLLLGNTNFYKSRGFFYDIRLGEVFKEIEG